MHIVLGSSSQARANILRQLKIAFTQLSPNIDETAKPGESAKSLVLRLSQEKMSAISPSITNPSLIITGDQVLDCNGSIFTKPHTYNNAVSQLQHLSLKKATFHTGVCMFNNVSKKYYHIHETTHLSYRKLSRTTIEKYVEIEQPYHCAGSFKYEGLGIALITHITSNDPYAIYGMPLLRICDVLAHEGIDIFSL